MGNMDHHDVIHDGGYRQIDVLSDGVFGSSGCYLFDGMYGSCGCFPFECDVDQTMF